MQIDAGIRDAIYPIDSNRLNQQCQKFAEGNELQITLDDFGFNIQHEPESSQTNS
jgi:hypothetical protein